MPNAATGPVAREMIARLTAALAPTRLELEDQSHQHVGHAGHDGRGESHFALTIESAAFTGLGPIERQQGLRRARRADEGARPRAHHPHPRAGRRLMETVTPVTHDLGEFKVRRTLPAKSRTMVGPFIFVDQFGPARLPPGKGMEVRPHPHINLATVTYLFEGAIEHRDSLGTRQVIEPGAINLMTAGRGIVHSERSPTAERAVGPSLYGMQTWLALPEDKEEIDPAFEHVAGSDLPLVEDEGVTARVLMGNAGGPHRGGHRA